MDVKQVEVYCSESRGEGRCKALTATRLVLLSTARVRPPALLMWFRAL